MAWLRDPTPQCLQEWPGQLLPCLGPWETGANLRSPSNCPVGDCDLASEVEGGIDEGKRGGSLARRLGPGPPSEQEVASEPATRPRHRRLPRFPGGTPAGPPAPALPRTARALPTEPARKALRLPLSRERAPALGTQSTRVSPARTGLGQGRTHPRDQPAPRTPPPGARPGQVQGLLPSRDPRTGTPRASRPPRGRRSLRRRPGDAANLGESGGGGRLGKGPPGGGGVVAGAWKPAGPGRGGGAGRRRWPGRRPPTSLSGTHCGSSRPNGLPKARCSGTMRRPLGERTSFLASRRADTSEDMTPPQPLGQRPRTRPLAQPGAPPAPPRSARG